MDQQPHDYDEYFIFLDNLRASGICNMFGATPYLIEAFPYLADDEATTILLEWMRTFDKRHTR